MGINRPNIWKPQWAWGTFYTNTLQPTAFAEVDVGVSLARTTDLAVAENMNLTLAGGTGIITTRHSGLYYLLINSCFSGAAADNFKMYFTIDGVEVANGQIQWNQKAAATWEVSMSTIYQINGGQTLDIEIVNLSDTSSINLKNFTQTLIKLY